MVDVRRFVQWTAQSWVAAGIGLLYLLWRSLVFIIPDSHYMDIRLIVARDAKVGEPVLLEVVRYINANYHAQWHVSVRQELGNSVSTVVCSSDAHQVYKVGPKLPAVRTLDFWTRGRCSTLPEGEYTITTTVEVDGGWLPDRTISYTTPLFKVTP